MMVTHYADPGATHAFCGATMPTGGGLVGYSPPCRHCEKLAASRAPSPPPARPRCGNAAHPFCDEAGAGGCSSAPPPAQGEAPRETFGGPGSPVDTESPGPTAKPRTAGGGHARREPSGSVAGNVAEPQRRPDGAIGVDARPSIPLEDDGEPTDEVIVDGTLALARKNLAPSAGYVRRSIEFLRAAHAAEKARADRAERDYQQGQVKWTGTLAALADNIQRRQTAEAEVSRLTGELRRTREELEALADDLYREGRDAGVSEAVRSVEARLRAPLSPPLAPDATPAAQPAVTKDGEER